MRVELINLERNWLLIFDNVEDMNDLSPYIPSEVVGHGSIIMTTQKLINFSVNNVFETVHIKSFGRDDAATLLFKYIQRGPYDEKEEEMSRVLADTVDCLPLAIATIGGYINQSGSDLQEYTETLQNSSSAWTASAVGPVNQYEKTLETVFDIAIAELSERARGVIGILAFLDPDHIPEAIFDRAIETESLSFLKTKIDLIETIRELQRRQLIQHDVSGSDSYLTVHRTVQWNTLLHLSKNYEQRWKVFQHSFRIVRDMLPAELPFLLPSADEWPRLQAYGPHILSLRTHCLWPDPPIELPANFAEILSDMGTYLWHAGRLPEGEEALETAVDIMDKNKLYGGDPLRAAALQTLGIISSFEGVSERQKSMNLRFKASEARKRAFDAIPQGEVTRDDEIKRWLVESDVAYGLVQQEDFKAADEIMERVLQKYREWGSENDYPYQYSQYYQIHAVCLMAAGKPIDSTKSITRCVELLVQSSDVMHPMTQLMRFIAGLLTWHAGEPKKALEIHQSVLEARQEIIGEFSQFTMESYSTCARLLAEQGDLKKAR